MKSVSLVFPHQLFEQHPALDTSRPVYVLEETLFFNQYKFHKQKLALHRASMKAFEERLRDAGFRVHYIGATSATSDVRELLEALGKQKVEEIHCVEVSDDWLNQRLRGKAKQLKIELHAYPSPMFLSSQRELDTYFKGRDSFFMADFYKLQRKHFDILMTKNGRPEGGKWSYDAENRLKYPKDKVPPEVQFPKTGKHWKEAVAYVETHFKRNYGEVDAGFALPVTYKESKAWLADFLAHRFAEFGPYEDAIVSKESILHHSVLTPMLNIGLLIPAFVLDEAVAYAKKHGVPLNSLEGFVRQVLGWREFIRGVYVYKGRKERTRNYWKFTRKIPEAFWKGETGIPPIDVTIKKVSKTGYCHHIERLMVLGNFMLLCEFDPDEVYEWFMVMFIDAYDWVMVPNIYGMSQFSDGGIMATKPYISGSNYLMKMSDYAKGDWQKIWDGLFWRFMDQQRDFFSQNPRLGMLLKTWEKMDEEKKKGHLKAAEGFLGKF